MDRIIAKLARERALIERKLRVTERAAWHGRVRVSKDCPAQVRAAVSAARAANHRNFLLKECAALTLAIDALRQVKEPLVLGISSGEIG